MSEGNDVREKKTTTLPEEGTQPEVQPEAQPEGAEQPEVQPEGAAAQQAQPAQDAAQPAAENVPAEPSAQQLEESLSKALSDAEDYKKKWYSVSAEYENYRKRTASARSQAYTEGRSDVIVKLFPIADSLERALTACADDKTREGIAMVLKNFEKLLEGEHVTAIAPVGEPFDAARCEAILAVDPKEGEESGIVREVYAKGYEQNGKILRFAQVLVTK